MEHVTSAKRPWLMVILLLLAGSGHADVWETREQWNEQWEARFNEWMGVRYTSNIFTEGEYAGIPHDCADSAYFARLLFAYENGLPFVIRDPAWVGPGSTRGPSFAELIAEHGEDSPYALVRPFIRNDMDDFDELPGEQRLLAFMQFVSDVVWTRSLLNDTYPVRIDRQWFRPGVVAVLPRQDYLIEPHPFFDAEEDRVEVVETAGHAQIVTEIDQRGVIHYLKSTMPAKVQALRSTTLNSFVPSADGGSFRYWKQPHQYDIDEDQLPGYGTEQFDIEGVFEEAVQPRLANVQETRAERLQRLSGEVCTQLHERVPVVMNAWRHKLQIGQIHCMQYEEYDIHSTPLRDSKIRLALEQLLRAAGSNTIDDKLAKTLNASCASIEYAPGASLAAADAARHLLDGSASSDPNQPPAVRWGQAAVEPHGCRLFY